MRISTETFPISSTLLAALPAKSRRQALAKARFASFEPGEVIFTPNATVERALFPTQGMVSLLMDAEDGRSLEIGLAGAGDALGTSLLFDAGQPRMSAIARSSVFAVALESDVLAQEMGADPALARLLRRYAYAFLCATGIGATCAIAHVLEQRCARWLITAQDYLSTDVLQLTQDELARNLGVRRASVTAAVTKLRRAGLVDFSHGLVRIANRRGLERAACGCHGRIRAEYALATESH